MTALVLPLSWKTCSIAPMNELEKVVSDSLHLQKDEICLAMALNS